MGDLYVLLRGSGHHDQADPQADPQVDEWYREYCDREKEREQEVYQLARTGRFRCSLCGDSIPESLLDTDAGYYIPNHTHMTCDYFAYAYDGYWPKTDIELVKAVKDCVMFSPDAEKRDSIGVWAQRFARIVAKFRARYGDRPSPAAQYESAMMRLITEHPDLDDEEFEREADRIYREHFG